MKITILMTPGLDSYITYNKFLFDKYFICDFLRISSLNDAEINFVYFNLNSKYSKIEMDYITKYYTNEKYPIDIVNMINIKDIEKSDANVPNRNILLVTMAQSIYDSDVIIINGVKDDRASDNNKEIFDNVSKILTKSANKPVNVTSLFWEDEKYNLVSKLNYCHIPGTSHEIVESTFSCYYPLEEEKLNNIVVFTPEGEIRETYSTYTKECGNCPACYRKACALTALEIFIPLDNELFVVNTTIKLLYEIPHTNNMRRFSINKYYNMYKKVCMELENINNARKIPLYNFQRVAM